MTFHSNPLSSELGHTVERTTSQSVEISLLNHSRRVCATEILGGDAKQDGHRLVIERLTNSRFVPPELWQQAMDAMVGADAEHPRFEELVLSHAVDEFARQFFLLTPAARQTRLKELREDAVTFPHLKWRLDRLQAGIKLSSTALDDLQAGDHEIAVTICRLFCLTLGDASRETRLRCRSICGSTHDTARFLNGVAVLNRISGMQGILSKSTLVTRVRDRSRKPKTRLRQPRIQSELSRRAAGTPQSSWGSMNLLFLILMISGALAAISGGSNQNSPPSYQTGYRSQAASLRSKQTNTLKPSTYVSPRFGNSAVPPFSQPPQHELLRLLIDIRRENGTILDSDALDRILEQSQLSPDVRDALESLAELRRTGEALTSPKEASSFDAEEVTDPDTASRSLKNLSPRTAERLFDRQAPQQSDDALSRMNLDPLPDVTKEYLRNGKPKSIFDGPSTKRSTATDGTSDFGDLPSGGSSVFSSKTGQSN